MHVPGNLNWLQYLTQVMFIFFHRHPPFKGIKSYPPLRKHSPRCTKKIIKYSLDCLQTAGFFSTVITGSIVSPSWSFSSRRHLFKNKDSNYSEHLPNNLRHNTYIEPFFSFPKYPLFCDIVNECNYKSISLICFDGISFFFICLFACHC